VAVVVVVTALRAGRRIGVNDERGAGEAEGGEDGNGLHAISFRGARQCAERKTINAPRVARATSRW
jgi:hypothetical protein